MNQKIILISFLISFLFSLHVAAFIPKPIQIDGDIFLDLLFEDTYENWQYYPFGFEAVGLKKVISIEAVSCTPKLITTEVLQKKDGWFFYIFKACIPDTGNSDNDFHTLNILKNGILGRYALKFEIKYEQFTKKGTVISTNFFFMLYKQNKNKRIQNLFNNYAKQADIRAVSQEEDVADDIDEDFDEKVALSELKTLVNEENEMKKQQIGCFNYMNCFMFFGCNLFDCH